jgi:hypothetical protein
MDGGHVKRFNFSSAETQPDPDLWIVLPMDRAVDYWEGE